MPLVKRAHTCSFGSLVLRGVDRGLSSTAVDNAMIDSMKQTPSWPPKGSGKALSVLVTYASRHGSTAAIAQAIADELEKSLNPTTSTVTCAPVKDVPTAEPFDAVILGSAVYVGRWLADARRFLSRNEETLADREVWFFSSGPLDSPDTTTAPKAAQVVLTRIGAREHKMFSGRLDVEQLGWIERTIARLVHAPEADFRDFTEIGRWAQQVAAQLTSRITSEQP
jgi:menaquinone-dependent protoporphyrinogen oxidase